MENTLRRKFQSLHRSVLKSGGSRANVHCWILSFCSMDGNIADTFIHSSKSASVFVLFLFFLPRRTAVVAKDGSLCRKKLLLSDYTVHKMDSGVRRFSVPQGKITQRFQHVYISHSFFTVSYNISHSFITVSYNISHSFFTVSYNISHSFITV